MASNTPTRFAGFGNFGDMKEIAINAINIRTDTPKTVRAMKCFQAHRLQAARRKSETERRLIQNNRLGVPPTDTPTMTASAVEINKALPNPQPPR